VFLSLNKVTVFVVEAAPDILNYCSNCLTIEYSRDRKMQMHRFRSLSILCLIWVACSAPPPVQESREERVRREENIGRSWVAKFKSDNIIKTQVADLTYLKFLTRKLMNADPELSGQSFEISLLKPNAKTWLNFSFPGNFIYLSAGLIQQLDVESEVAALIALELGRLKSGLVAQKIDPKFQPRIRDRAPIPTPSPSSSVAPPDFLHTQKLRLFDFSSWEEEIGMSEGVKILYQGEFDARGMVRMLEQHFKNLERSQYTEEKLIELVALARSKITLVPPLRNPKVNSPEFKAFLAKIREIKG